MTANLLRQKVVYANQLSCYPSFHFIYESLCQALLYRLALSPLPFAHTAFCKALAPKPPSCMIAILCVFWPFYLALACLMWGTARQLCPRIGTAYIITSPLAWPFDIHRPRLVLSHTALMCSRDESLNPLYFIVGVLHALWSSIFNMTVSFLFLLLIKTASVFCRAKNSALMLFGYRNNSQHILLSLRLLVPVALVAHHTKYSKELTKVWSLLKRQPSRSIF